MARTKSTKTKQVEQVKETQVLQTVSKMGLDSAAQSIAKTQVEVQKSLAGLSANLIEKLSELNSIDEAIALKATELKTLHDIEASATTLNDLHAEIETGRTDWQREQRLHAEAIREQEADRQKVWKRDEEDHNYVFSQRQRQIQDAFNAEQTTKQKQFADHEESLKKLWAERESGLKKAEQELADLRSQVAGFPELQKKEIAKAEAVLENVLKRHYETEAKLAAKEADGNAKLAEQTITTLRQQLASQNETINNLRHDLMKSNQEVKEIATAAVNAQSGRQALEAVQRANEGRESGGSGKMR